MSYYISQISWNFLLKREHFVEATEALRLLSEEILGSVEGLPSILPSEDTVGNNLIETLRDLGINPLVTEQGIIDLRLDGNLSRYTVRILATLAPFVEDGSFYEMIGDDDSVWRWAFREGQLYEELGRIEYLKSDTPIKACDTLWGSPEGKQAFREVGLTQEKKGEI